MEPVLEEKPVASPPPPEPRFVIGVRVRDQEKSIFFDPGNLHLRVGVKVMTESRQGAKLGVVASNKILNVYKRCNRDIGKVLRIANDNDLKNLDRIQGIEKRAKELCARKISELCLPMNLSRVLHIPEMNKTIFFFTAEGRVDFRQLIRELASNLRHRIEMKQVGVRDEARAIGGVGMCGETLCCSTFLPEFTPVTIRMAKDQGLALNPTKISGVCGRLMCCLQYEHEQYRKLIRGLPKQGNRVETPDGPGKVLKLEILQQRIIIRLEDESIMSYSLGDIQQVPKTKNINQKSPQTTPSPETKKNGENR